MTHSEPRATTVYGRCEAQHCAHQAVGRCRCGMLLCAMCLARHARYPSAKIVARHQQDEQEEQQP